jgi:hypothetical protein
MALTKVANRMLSGAAVSPNDYGAVGDGVTDDTVAIQAALNSGKSVSFESNGVYISDFTFIDSIDDIVINGNGATLKRLSTSPGQDYHRGAQIALQACSNVTFKDLIFDGNRPNLIVDTPTNVSMNNGISVYGNNAGGSDVQFNGGGEDKGSKNINILGCKFYRSGSTGVGIDKFGDGVHGFGVDGLTVKDCYFEDMGRWAVSSGDCFNVTIENNIINNDSAGTALGSIDIENESSDTTNGSYSRNIRIIDNKMTGRVSMTVSAYDSTSNSAGSNHYTKDVRVENNEMYCNQYATNGEWGINVLISKRDVSPPTMSEVWISNNKIIGESATRLSYGISVQGNLSTVTVKDFWVTNNTIKGFTDGIYVKSTQSPTLTNFRVLGNTVSSEHNANGTGITVEGDTLDGIFVKGNYVRDYNAFGIKVIKNAGTTSFAVINDNMVFEGLATFTGTGIRSNGDIITVNDNFVSQTGGVDYDLEATTNISNALCNLKTKMVTLSGFTGATMTSSIAFPAGCLVVGVTTRVTTLITGATSQDIGDGTDVDMWGSGRGVALGSTTDIQQSTLANPKYDLTGKNIVFTAVGGNYTAGAVKISIHYFELEPFKG